MDQNTMLRIRRIKKECDNLCEKLNNLAEEDVNELRWSDARDYQGSTYVTLHSAPLDISWILKEELYPKRTVVMTSATLSGGGSFDYFKQQMGMPDTTKELVAHSPFDFEHNSLVYITDGSNDKISELEQLLTASKGRAFILFTSYKEMRQTYDYVRIPYPKLIQEGTRGRRELLEEFKNTPNAVLFATKSFWEGVDVQGESLSLVVIDKLPFGNPFDLMYKSKQDRVEKTLGRGSGFSKFAVPEACISFKQGVGRLIRSTSDRGVIAIMDARVGYKNYGAAFVRSLPEKAPRTRKLENVIDFFNKG
jgi:ATP-dependent DNA helicase DinG